MLALKYISELPTAHNMIYCLLTHVLKISNIRLKKIMLSPLTFPPFLSEPDLKTWKNVRIKDNTILSLSLDS